jgi:hypothetical protein
MLARRSHGSHANKTFLFYSNAANKPQNLGAASLMSPEAPRMHPNEFYPRAVSLWDMAGAAFFVALVRDGAPVIFRTENAHEPGARSAPAVGNGK